MTEREAQNFIDILPEDIFDISLNEYMKLGISNQAHCYLFHVGINSPEREVPMDPYLIGYWLGDGDSGHPQITTADPEIVQEFYRILESYDMTLSETSNSIRYYIRGKGEDHHKCGGNKFLNALRHLNMLDNKHIPDIYKINSRSVRIRVLAGLIESDGYAIHDCIEITQKNKRLADDIEYLAFSLGFMITRVECTKGCSYKGEMRYGQYQRRVIFGNGIEEIPVILTRKRSNPRLIKKRARCQGFKVESLGTGEYHGFNLSGDGRFLQGDFLVAHA